MAALLSPFCRQGAVRTALFSCQGCHSFLSRQPERHNSNRTTVCRLNRRYFLRQYPTMLVLTDGSTINVRYAEPRRIIKLPVDLNELSEEERKSRLQRRKPKQKLVMDDDLDDDNFDVTQYSHLWKK